jgi:pyrroline-5-carboxylate reductase
MTSLLIVGGGKMGSALLGGILSSGLLNASECAVLEPVAATRGELASRFPGVAVLDAPVHADGVILAVKPKDAIAACRALDRESARRVLSIVAGIAIADLEAALWPGCSVIRSMPNTPALVGAGAAAISGGAAAGPEDLEWAERLLSAVGIVVQLPEQLLDAVTGLSGSGPAYFFFVVEAMIEAGVLAGLDRSTATTLANQTVLGAARLLVESGESAESLRHAVTSPAGTTAAGLAVLEERGVRAAFLAAVTAAVERSKALGAHS